MRAKVDVILALSEEKIEVYPKQQHPRGPKFWKRQKSLSYSTEALVACEVLEKRSNGKWLLRLVLVETAAEADDDEDGAAQQHQHHRRFQTRKHDFECPEREAVEVHSKLNHLLAWRPEGEARRWYRKEKAARLHRGHSWHLK